MRGAPGLLLRGTGVAHEGGPPHEQVSRTGVVVSETQGFGYSHTHIQSYTATLKIFEEK